MKILARYTFAVSLALLSGAALAQFSFSLPGFGKSGGGGGSGVNVSNIIDGAKALKEPTEEEEIALGQQFTSVLLGAKPLLNNAGAQRYVNTLGRWIASQTERPDLPWTFGILDDSGYNAFATPGGYILITRGLLERMGSEAELAGVLAHEIGHVLMKHHLKATRNSGLLKLGGEIVSAKTGGNDQLKEAAKNLVTKLFTSGLDKSDEYEADRIGVVLAARAGYDPFGLPAVLQMLQGHSGSEASFSLMFETHPTPVSRLEQLDKLMESKFDGLPHVHGKSIVERLKEFK